MSQKKKKAPGPSRKISDADMSRTKVIINPPLKEEKKASERLYELAIDTIREYLSE